MRVEKRTLLRELLEKVKNNNFTLAVIGLGRVGLPLATVFASSNVKTIGFDIDRDLIKKISEGTPSFHEPGLRELLRRVIKRWLVVTTNVDEIFDADVLIVTVGTPLTKDLQPDHTQLLSALKPLARPSLKGKVVVIRSTTSPGTLEEIVKPVLEKGGLKAGVDFGLVACPERIAEGRAIEELRTLPEIVGGIDSISSKIVGEIFRKINPRKKIIYTTPIHAELAKLFTNVFRYVNFALANEFALLSEKYGADAFEVIKIANMDYPRGSIPTPGLAGGPCLSKDGYYLLRNQIFPDLIMVAWRLNEFLPLHIVHKLSEELRIVNESLVDVVVGVLGLAYKKDVDDTRYSPAERLVRLLQTYGAKTLVHDPYVKGTLPLDEVLSKSDVLILAVNHNTFTGLEEHIEASDNVKLVYDAWGVFDPKKFKRVRYLRLGRGSK